MTDFVLTFCTKGKKYVNFTYFMKNLVSNSKRIQGFFGPKDFYYCVLGMTDR